MRGQGHGGDGQGHGRHRLSASTLHSIRVRYGQIIAAGRLTNPGPPSLKRHGYERKAYNLLVRLDTQRADVLRFASDFRASFDNNQAERDIRMVKLQQKISGSWRTLAGARTYCAIRSYVSTLRKQNQDILGRAAPPLRRPTLVTGSDLSVAKPVGLCPQSWPGDLNSYTIESGSSVP